MGLIVIKRFQVAMHRSWVWLVFASCYIQGIKRPDVLMYSLNHSHTYSHTYHVHEFLFASSLVLVRSFTAKAAVCMKLVRTSISETADDHALTIILNQRTTCDTAVDFIRSLVRRPTCQRHLRSANMERSHAACPKYIRSRTAAAAN